MKRVLYFFKMPIPFFFAMAMFTSCIGDKVMLVRYQVDNQTHEPLYLPNTLDNKGGQLIVLPNERKTVHHNTYVCWMGDCRMHMETEGFLDSISVYQDSTMEQNLSYTRQDWKLRKNRAVLVVE